MIVYTSNDGSRHHLLKNRIDANKGQVRRKKAIIGRTKRNTEEPQDDWDTVSVQRLWTAVLYYTIIERLEGRKRVKVRKENGRQVYDKIVKEIRVEDVEYFNSDEIEVGSFAWICEALGYDKDKIRRRIG